jgi:hypothetical protein
MKDNVDSQEKGSGRNAPGRSHWPWVLVGGCLLVIFLGMLNSSRYKSTQPSEASAVSRAKGGDEYNPDVSRSLRLGQSSRSTPAVSAEEVVAGKLSQFGRSRLEFVNALARKHNVQVSDDVKAFFAAVQSGKWEEIDAAYKKINGGDSSGGQAEGRAPELQHLWPAIVDAYGAAEQVHEWPAQKLLDYGNAVLGSLRPGMVYVGGTDNGRWIPELLNDTSDGERHVILTQNALADGTYLDYLRLQYDERLSSLTAEDSQHAFEEYLADARKRLDHDTNFPDEPKQIRPGEDIRVTDNRTQVSGQVAVMSINEKLLQALMAKNPDAQFALQESFPLKGTYGDALPLGPLMELQAKDGKDAFTPERATQWLDYWRNTAQQVLADPEAGSAPSALKSYSHDTVSAANLLADHKFSAEAEQAYRLATQLWPENPESVNGLAGLLLSTGREKEARQLFDDFTRQYPGQLKELERSSAAFRFIGPAEKSRR